MHMQYYGGINTEDTHKDSKNLPVYDTDGSYTATETPIETESKIENMGIAVFKNDKLVGELTGMESLCHLFIIGEFENATISVPNPYNIESVINLRITSNKKPKNKVKLINNTPFIECNIDLKANILSLQENVNYTDLDTLRLIEDYTNSYLENNILSYLYKTSKEFNSDIDNFGKYVIGNYYTWDEWIDSDWLGNYKNSFFKVKVNTNIENGGLFTKL